MLKFLARYTKTQPSWKGWVYSNLIALGIGIILFCTASIVLVNTPYTEYVYRNIPVTNNLLLTLDEQIHLGTSSTTAINMLSSDSAEQSLINLKWQGKQFLTMDEISHLIDVQKRLVVAKAVALIGLVTIIWKPGVWLNHLKKTYYLIGMISMYTILSWQSFFTKFHQMLFPHGNWSFDTNLIHLLPVDFWFTTAIFLLAIIHLLIGVIYASTTRIHNSRN